MRNNQLEREPTYFELTVGFIELLVIIYCIYKCIHSERYKRFREEADRKHDHDLARFKKWIEPYRKRVTEYVHQAKEEFGAVVKNPTENVEVLGQAIFNPVTTLTHRFRRDVQINIENKMGLSNNSMVQRLQRTTLSSGVDYLAVSADQYLHVLVPGLNELNSLYRLLTAIGHYVSPILTNQSTRMIPRNASNYIRLHFKSITDSRPFALTFPFNLRVPNEDVLPSLIEEEKNEEEKNQNLSI